MFYFSAAVLLLCRYQLFSQKMFDGMNRIYRMGVCLRLAFQKFILSIR